jgi:hypothetical protein
MIVIREVLLLFLLFLLGETDASFNIIYNKHAHLMNDNTLPKQHCL